MLNIILTFYIILPDAGKDIYQSCFLDTEESQSMQSNKISFEIINIRRK